MSDVHSKETRSFNMSRIKGKNTKPEISVRQGLHAAGIRFRLHDKNLPGKPDIILPKFKSVIFVNGCFWHGHEGCRHYTIPKTRPEWWLEKITATKSRDLQAIYKLKELDWNVISIWECELKPSMISMTIEKLIVDLMLGLR